MQAPDSEVGGLADLGESCYNRRLETLAQCGNSKPTNFKVMKKVKERGRMPEAGDVVAALG
jgi:hypothetical protein